MVKTGRALEQPLTGEQVAEFFRQGFLVIDKPQIDAAELKWCGEVLMSMIESGQGRSEGRNLDLTRTDGAGDMISPSVLQPSMYALELRQLSYRKAALDIARQLLGPKATFAGDHAIYKPMHKGHPTPWHQDEAFREPGLEYNEISIWIAITDSTVDNGAMSYIPGSHRLGVLPHRLHGGSKGANTIECCEGFDQRQAVTRPIPAGAMIIHHCRTVHGAFGNKTGTSRLAYILQYSTPVRMSKTLRHAPWLEGLRTQNQAQRRGFLLRGGVFLEFMRLLRSDRNSHRQYFSYFWRRRLNKMRALLKH
jgi:hypothetical protein